MGSLSAVGDGRLDLSGLRVVIQLRALCILSQSWLSGQSGPAMFIPHTGSGSQPS